MARKCGECSHNMVPCDKSGTPDMLGGYLVCPMAQAEQTRGEFERPNRKRVHAQARIEETPATRNKRLAEKREAQPFTFDVANTGKRASAA